MKDISIGFIGLGNMAGAIIKGLRNSRQFAITDIIGYDRNLHKQEAYFKDFEVQIAQDACAAAASCSLLVLAIKPQGMDELLNLVKPCLKADQLVISLAAGKTLGSFSATLGSNVALVRAMPNINARVGASMTALCHNDLVSAEQLESATAVFDAIGSVLVLPESKLPAFSAIAGAGPAFAYAFIDALATAGIRAGLPRPLAQQAACAMLFGSAKLVTESGEHPRALIDQVTSPGGTTIEGMHKLAELGFEHAVQAAINAVIEKEWKMAHADNTTKDKQQ